jgi:ABC-type tungstate transport system substrate-binding protein
MKKLDFAVLKFVGAIVMLFSMTPMVIGQNVIPDVLYKSSFKDQMAFIEEKTRIYENYRAIREDMFQLIKKNSLDSINSLKNEISSLKLGSDSQSRTINSLKTSLESTGGQLEKMTRTKNSINLFGFEIKKGAYNSIMWLIITLLAIVIIAGFLSYKRNLVVTMHTKKDYEDLKKEFEAYRKASREAREKMSMAHFNELKRLRTG